MTSPLTTSALTTSPITTATAATAKRGMSYVTSNDFRMPADAPGRARQAEAARRMVTKFLSSHAVPERVVQDL